VIEVVLVAGTVRLGLIKPDDDCAIVLISLGGHDLRHDEPQEVVTLRDLGCACRKRRAVVRKAARQCSMHIIELVRRNP